MLHFVRLTLYNLQRKGRLCQISPFTLMNNQTTTATKAHSSSKRAQWATTKHLDANKKICHDWTNLCWLGVLDVVFYFLPLRKGKRNINCNVNTVGLRSNRRPFILDNPTVFLNNMNISNTANHCMVWQPKLIWPDIGISGSTNLVQLKDNKSVFQHRTCRQIS